MAIEARQLLCRSATLENGGQVCSGGLNGAANLSTTSWMLCVLRSTNGVVVHAHTCLHPSVCGSGRSVQ